ncbi:hypothetical protein HY311_00640 [Candidatus Nomurabacteria bacterium]|nr:hypothetical protein [Candidatus Nomurabacteria bacterium]
MMINLIPKEEKKKMTMDFYYRLLVLFLAMVSFSVFVALVSILPSYFLSVAKNSEVNMKLETQKKEPLPLLGEQALSTIQDMNKKLGLVESAEKNKFPLSLKVVSAVVLRKMPNIKITEISYQNDSTKGKQISVTGTAPSREVLLLFRQSLEESMAFKSVDLPISNFIKGSDIKFNLMLIPS